MIFHSYVSLPEGNRGPTGDDDVLRPVAAHGLSPITVLSIDHTKMEKNIQYLNLYNYINIIIMVDHYIIIHD